MRMLRMVVSFAYAVFCMLLTASWGLVGGVALAWWYWEAAPYTIVHAVMFAVCGVLLFYVTSRAHSHVWYSRGPIAGVL